MPTLKGLEKPNGDTIKKLSGDNINSLSNVESEKPLLNVLDKMIEQDNQQKELERISATLINLSGLIDFNNQQLIMLRDNQVETNTELRNALTKLSNFNFTPNAQLEKETLEKLKRVCDKELQGDGR